MNAWDLVERESARVAREQWSSATRRPEGRGAVLLARLRAVRLRIVRLYFGDPHLYEDTPNPYAGCIRCPYPPDHVIHRERS